MEHLTPFSRKAFWIAATISLCRSVPMASVGITSVSCVVQYPMPISAYFRMISWKPISGRVGAWNSAWP